jgi:phosphatidylserine/phosphatidylglycerophosphate/cardiolipin synthase-like enzyme
MLIDDIWATIGSCNLHGYSLFGNGEMNVAFHAPDIVHALRCELLKEHIGRDTSNLDDRTALRLFRTVAARNRLKFDSGDTGWEGLAFKLNAATFGH